MANTYELIAAVTVPSAQATIDFTSIPSTFTDLVLKVSARTSESNTYSGVSLSFNGATTNRSYRLVYGAGSGSGASESGTSLTNYGVNGSTATASSFGNLEWYIPNYANSGIYKSVSSDGVSETNATAALANLAAGLWSSNAAITSISIAVNSGGATFQQYSTAYLYGVKNA